MSTTIPLHGKPKETEARTDTKTSESKKQARNQSVRNIRYLDCFLRVIVCAGALYRDPYKTLGGAVIGAAIVQYFEIHQEEPIDSQYDDRIGRIGSIMCSLSNGLMLFTPSHFPEAPFFSGYSIAPLGVNFFQKFYHKTFVE